MSEKKVTLSTIQKRKENHQPITMLTAYDYPTALAVDESGADMILVGDSVGMVVHGFESTLPVTMDMMLMHCKAVRRGAKRALVIGDLPFMSYQVSAEEARRNAGRLIAESGVDAVKLEGGIPMAETIRSIVDIGIAVQGHIGLTPQSISAFGGFKTQGRSTDAARDLIEDALALEDAGVFSMVLEGIPSRLATLISHKLSIPTIGIGAGVGCDGQVLVLHDILGLFDQFVPKFVKKYGDVKNDMQTAIQAFLDEVKNRQFPSDEYEYHMDEEVWDEIESRFGGDV